jgi:hypothetical protein|tara:strand:+ start:160 stop:525 length:366 start_codon:yes stop_codon:yes gene_type:complete
MTLDCNYQKVKTQGWNKKQIETVSTFCFPMMAIDMNEITENNIDEIMIRFNYLEMIGQSVFAQPINNHTLYDQLIDYIGLTTNVAKKSRTYFVNRQAKWVSGNASGTVYTFIDKLTAERKI